MVDIFGKLKTGASFVIIGPKLRVFSTKCATFQKRALIPENNPYLGQRIIFRLVQWESCSPGCIGDRSFLLSAPNTKKNWTKVHIFFIKKQCKRGAKAVFWYVGNNSFTPYPPKIGFKPKTAKVGQQLAFLVILGQILACLAHFLPSRQENNAKEVTR